MSLILNRVSESAILHKLSSIMRPGSHSAEVLIPALYLKHGATTSL